MLTQLRDRKRYVLDVCALEIIAEVEQAAARAVFCSNVGVVVIVSRNEHGS